MSAAGEGALREIYRIRFAGQHRARGGIWRVLVEHFFQAWIRRSDTVLDLGCGYGEFLNNICAARRIGVDLNPDSVYQLTSGIEFHRGRVDELGEVADDSIDVVFTSNLLEHLSSKADVERTVAEVRRVLVPGGTFIALGPNIRYVPGAYWDFWDHLVPITDRALCELLEISGFEVVDVVDRFLPYTMRSALPQAEFLVRLYLKVPFVWRFLGKQFLIRARKPVESRRASSADLLSVVVPVYNEGENIRTCVRRLYETLEHVPHEILICYDFEQDNTLLALDAMSDRPASVRLVRNTLGRGVANALIAGFAASRGDVVVTSMADLSDPPAVILHMLRKVREEGFDVVSGSRYMRGGIQVGGPRLKTLLSRIAGLSLHYVAGIPTHDATTNFRAYSRRVLDRVIVESRRGFEVGLEVTVKAHRLGLRVGEVPSTWHDRTAGQSKFDLVGWLPSYLRWYRYALATAFFGRHR